LPSALADGQEGNNENRQQEIVFPSKTHLSDETALAFKKVSSLRGKGH